MLIRAMRRMALVFVLVGTMVTAEAARTLDLYFIDVEGGQATLIVTPAGETLLVDTGFPSDGTFQSVAGDPAKARDANRIAEAARAAGVNRIDYLLITHFHADHDGGVVELARLMPIRTFIDHETPSPDVDATSAGARAAFDAYAAVRAKGRHVAPAPGARLPLKGIETIVVSAGGATITKPLPGAGAATPSCTTATKPDEPNENPRSTGIRLQYGAFTFLDVGDLSGDPLFALTCPRSLIGPVSVYL